MVVVVVFVGIGSNQVGREQAAAGQRVVDDGEDVSRRSHFRVVLLCIEGKKAGALPCSHRHNKRMSSTTISFSSVSHGLKKNRNSLQHQNQHQTSVLIQKRTTPRQRTSRKQPLVIVWCGKTWGSFLSRCCLHVVGLDHPLLPQRLRALVIPLQQQHKQKQQQREPQPQRRTEKESQVRWTVAGAERAM